MQKLATKPGKSDVATARTHDLEHIRILHNHLQWVSTLLLFLDE
jgi:hypothetical protein